MIKRITTPRGEEFRLGQSVLFHHADDSVLPATIKAISRKGPRFQLAIPGWVGYQWVRWSFVKPNLEGDDNE